MLKDINRDRFLTERRVIEIRHILPDIEQYIAETTDPDRRDWLERMRQEFLDELADLETILSTIHAT